MIQSEEVLQGSGIASVASTYHNGISRLIRENDAWWSIANTTIEADFGVMVQATLLAAQELMGKKAAEIAVLQPRIQHFATTLEIAFTAATSLEKQYTNIQSPDDVTIVHRFGATISATLNQVQQHTGEAAKQTATDDPTSAEEQTDEQELFSNEGSIANIFSDAANPGLKDHLDFESDYIALASEPGASLERKR